MLPEVTLLMGEVPLVPYATTGTPALGDAVVSAVVARTGASGLGAADAVGARPKDTPVGRPILSYMPM